MVALVNRLLAQKSKDKTKLNLHGPAVNGIEGATSLGWLGRPSGADLSKSLALSDPAPRHAIDTDAVPGQLA